MVAWQHEKYKNDNNNKICGGGGVSYLPLLNKINTYQEINNQWIIKDAYPHFQFWGTRSEYLIVSVFRGGGHA